MTIEQYNKYGEELETLYRLRSMPIAFKFCESVKDVPENALFPKRDLKKHMAVCQAFSYARMKGQTIAMTTEDHWCWNPLIAYGNIECVKGMESFDIVCKYIGIPDKEKAEEFFSKFPRMPLGKYEAIVVAPLSKATFEPDIIIIYAENPKINHMLRTIKGITGDYTRSVFDGIDSCIYCTVPPFEKNEYRVTFPDPGDIERARARDDEMILSVPAARLEEFMTAVEKDKIFLPYSDKFVDLPLDYAQVPFYKELFKIWGLDEQEGEKVMRPKENS